MRSLEIFSGAGGLAKGLEAAGFQHVSLVENNKEACASLRSNFESACVFEGDIASFDLKTAKGVDIIAGGPPCQPFSLGGKHQAHQDKRDMFPQAIRCVEFLQPKAFLFENVKGILRTSFSLYFEYILYRLRYPTYSIKNTETWEEHGLRLKKLDPSRYDGVRYHVSYKNLNAADYGIPQKRERVILLGLRSDVGKTWTFPEATHSEDALDWEKFVTGEYWKKHDLPRQENPLRAHSLTKKYGFFPPIEAPWQTVRDAFVGIPHPNDEHGIPDHTFKDGARSYPGHTGSDLDQPSKTLKAGDHGVPGGENMLRDRRGEIRYFTVFEAKLLQTFPKSFVFAGAWSEAMRQIGNAVPVKLAHVLGKHVAATLGMGLEADGVPHKTAATPSLGNGGAPIVRNGAQKKTETTGFQSKASLEKQHRLGSGMDADGTQHPSLFP